MADLVLGMGTSHGPSIQSAPEQWARLGERDMRDPRGPSPERAKA